MSNNDESRQSISRYLPLFDAACLLGQRRFPKEWIDSNIELLENKRAEVDNFNDWDCAANVQSQLQKWISCGELESYGVDDEGRISKIESKWNTTPYFEISIAAGTFRVFEDLWEPILVDRFQLVEKLDGIRRLRPKKEQVFDWKAVTNQMWKIALDLPLPRTASALIGATLQWHIDETDHEPDPEEIRELANEIIDHLGARKLSKEEFESDSDRDAVETMT